VVVVSGPRLGAGASRDTALPSYWRYAAASCDGIAATLATLERPAGARVGPAAGAAVAAAGASAAGAAGAAATAAGAGGLAGQQPPPPGVGTQAAAAAEAAASLWVATLARACDATPLCRGFQPASGRLLTRVDRASCTGVTDVRAGPGVGVESGVYSKSAITVAPHSFPLWLPTRPPGQAPPLPLSGDGSGGGSSVEVGLSRSALLASGLGPDAAAVLSRAVRLVGGAGAAATNAAAVGAGARTVTDAATVTSEGWGFELWWAAAGADVYKEDLGPSGEGAPQQGGDAAHIVAVAQHCRKEGPATAAPATAAGSGGGGGCAGVHWPSGWFKTSSDSGVLHFAGGAMAGDGASGAGLYLSRTPIPPLDYVSDTVISLLREMGGGVADIDGAGAAGVCYGAGGDSGGGGGGGAASNAGSSSSSSAGAASAAAAEGQSRAFRGRTHLYVVDTSPEAMHGLPQGSGASYPPADSGSGSSASSGAAGAAVGAAAGAAVAPLTHDAVLPQRYTPRALQGQAGGGGLDVHGPASPDYWFHAFAYLRRRFGHLPCVTFLSHGAYPRLRETAPPAKGRGQPRWHADNRRKSMERGKVSQTLDFVGGLRAAAALSPRAHAMVWEDDAHACNGTLRLLAAFTGVLDSGLDPRWGMVRVGNGGSGLLVQHEIVSGLTPYLVTRRGSENVDVSMWRYAHSGGYPDYISRLSWSAHRGLYSSFRGGAGAAPTWGRVHCSNELDFHWGWMKDCDVSRLTRGGAGAGAAAAGSSSSSQGQTLRLAPPPGQAAGAEGSASTQQRQGQSPLPPAALEALFSQFRCSVYSPATDGILQRP